MADHPPRKAVILVRNDVIHDSRVLREARTLRELGFEVLVIGQAPDGQPHDELTLGEVRVVRLSREQPLRRLLQRDWGRNDTATSDEHPNRAGGDDRSVTSSGDARRKMRLPKLRRKVGRIAYSLHGIVLTWRTAPALVHANDYNTMWVGVASKLLRGSRLVYDAHELWPDQGLAEWRPRQLACEWLFVRVADANVAANPGIAETMARRYRIAAPIVVRNVPEHVLETSPRAEGLRAGKSPMAVHVGGLVPERGLELTIQALALVPRLRLRFIGTGSEEYRAELEECAKVAGVAERIEFRPPVEPDAIVDTISGADLGVLLTQPTCLNNVRSLPNKLFEYAAAGLPIVASDLPVIAEIVDGAGIGETVPPADVGAIADAMRRIAEPTRNAALRKQVSAFARSVTWSSERKVLEGVYAALSLD